MFGCSHKKSFSIINIHKKHNFVRVTLRANNVENLLKVLRLGWANWCRHVVFFTNSTKYKWLLFRVVFGCCSLLVKNCLLSLADPDTDSLIVPGVTVSNVTNFLRCLYTFTPSLDQEPELQRISLKFLDKCSLKSLLWVGNLYQLSTTLGLEPVSIIHYTRPGSSIKQPTPN